MPLSHIQTAAVSIVHPSLLLCSIPFVKMYHSLFNHSHIEGHVDCFLYFTTLNKVAMNICAQVFV